MQAIGLDVQILNEDGEEVVIKELDDEDEIEQDQSQQDEIRDVMEETNTASAGVPQEKRQAIRMTMAMTNTSMPVKKMTS